MDAERLREFERRKQELQNQWEIEEAMANASQDLMIAELLEGKPDSYIEGFWKGREMVLEEERLLVEAVDKRRYTLVSEFPDLFPDEMLEEVGYAG